MTRTRLVAILWLVLVGGTSVARAQKISFAAGGMALVARSDLIVGDGAVESLQSQLMLGSRIEVHLGTVTLNASGVKGSLEPKAGAALPRNAAEMRGSVGVE